MGYQGGGMIGTRFGKGSSISGGRREQSSLTTRFRAFTLIELLTVIVIIGVLAAITFPVFARAKVAAMRSSDVSNMNTLRSALQLYRADQEGYPPGLLGYVTPYQSGVVDMATVVPANVLKGALFPRRVDSISTFKPGLDKAHNEDTTHAVWPDKDGRAIGTAPILDLNGDGSITGADDVPQARQLFGPSDGFVMVDQATVTADPLKAANFYQVSGYEVAEVDTPTGKRDELHYAIFWSNWGLGGGNLSDDPRQLGYADPPESTVITWNSYFRDYNNGKAVRNKNEIVLFLSGGAKNYDALDASQRSWRVMPQ
jgi:prepilin-type N-terminal cleavage/methylation domain-containing protein